MNDLSSWLASEVVDVDAKHLRRPRRSIRTQPDAWCEFNGKRLRNFASNDYLNFAHDQKLISAAKVAIDQAGVGSTASALVCGRSPWHDALERRIAEFEGQQAALLFPSGYAANIGTIAALTTADDVLFCDRLNHACLIDGARLSKAKRVLYDSQDVASLADALDNTQTTGRRWILTDAVFSMDGQIAPLDQLCDLADQYDATLIIDEAHGTGIFGEHGRGVSEQLGVEHRNVIRTGTLSKAIGCLGGFVSGSEQLIDFLWHKARTQFFSTALPPSVCAAATAAFDLITDEPQRRHHVMKISQVLRERLTNISPGAECPAAVGPIVPLILHEPTAATSLADQLREAGLMVAAIRPPTVPVGTSRLRISLTAAHSVEDVNNLANKIAACLEGIAC